MTTARHFRRLGVLGIDLLETAGITLGRGDDALLVTFGFLEQARRRASGFRNHVIGVGLAFVLLPLAVLPALTASSNAACTCSGGCAFCIVTFEIRMPVL
jgi:hypothetical protein